jgi:hypothetical protein
MQNPQIARSATQAIPELRKQGIDRTISSSQALLAKTILAGSDLQN